MKYVLQITSVHLKGQRHEIWDFFKWIYIESASFKDPLLIFLYVVSLLVYWI
jgi:hypothetical protein